MARKLGIVTLMVGFAFAVPLFAHHGAASFDSGKTVTVKGTVTEYVWSNPHVLVKVDAKDDTGTVQHWVLEAWNPVTQAGRGWSTQQILSTQRGRLGRIRGVAQTQAVNP